MFSLRIIQNMCKYSHKNTNIIHVQAHGTYNKHFCFEGVHSKHSICQCHCRTLTIPHRMQTLPHTRFELTLISKTVTILFLLKEGGNYTSEIFITHRVTLMKEVINLQYHSENDISPYSSRKKYTTFSLQGLHEITSHCFFTKLLKNIKL